VAHLLRVGVAHPSTKMKQTTTATNVIVVDKKVHGRFKRWCVKNGYKMGAAATKLLKEASR